MNATRRQQPRRLVVKLYQFFHISSAFLYCALLVRWLVLLPLVSRKYLPGGIHRFLCCLMVYSAIGNILWWVKMRGLAWSIFNRHNLKNINLIYLVAILHFYDDFEHSPVLKNTSYSSFIVGLSFTQMYYHWNRIFKGPSLEPQCSKSLASRINAFIMIPLVYLSEFYLLLLNTEIDNYHNGPKTVLFNKFVLVVFIPLCLHLYKGFLYK
ncbi:Keg1 [Kluyveromyces lactis]|nr:Keg1 [Kluyveromyces lactis]